MAIKRVAIKGEAKDGKLTIKTLDPATKALALFPVTLPLSPIKPTRDSAPARGTIPRMKTRPAAVIAFLAFFSAFCSSQENPDLRSRVGDGVYAAIGSDTGKAGSNAGFIIGNDGVVVVDTFEGVAPAQKLLAEIQKLTKLPVRYVVNTHYHLDHTGGNAAFQKAGTTILAQKEICAAGCARKI